MFDKVIFGIVGEAGGRDAMALAKVLVADGGRMTLANVYPGESYVWRGGNPAYQIAEEEDARALLERTAREERLDADLRIYGDPSVGKGLHVLAEETGADLLVIGSSRHGLMHRVMVGDDTRAALNGAPCAVAIAPAGYAAEPTSIREIGVGYNGSDESDHALAVARELAARYGAKLSAFEAVSLPTSLVHGRMAPAGTPDDLVEQAREKIAALGGVEPHAAYGEPAEERALYSASLDLLVIGSRDFGPIGRLMHGSTTRRLARSARCPMLVLTRAARTSRPQQTAEQKPETALTGR